MITFNIPGDRQYTIENVVCDFNGTLAVDGTLLPGVEGAIRRLVESVTVHVVTADTFGSARRELEGLPVEVTILPRETQDEAKAELVDRLGADGVLAIGNGRNDLLMLRAAAIGICVLQREGAYRETMQAADVVCASPVDALELLLNPKRLIATFRR